MIMMEPFRREDRPVKSVDHYTSGASSNRDAVLSTVLDAKGDEIPFGFPTISLGSEIRSVEHRFSGTGVARPGSY